MPLYRVPVEITSLIDVYVENVCPRLAREWVAAGNLKNPTEPLVIAHKVIGDAVRVEAQTSQFTESREEIEFDLDALIRDIDAKKAANAVL